LTELFELFNSGTLEYLLYMNNVSLVVVDFVLLYSQCVVWKLLVVGWCWLNCMFNCPSATVRPQTYTYIHALYIFLIRVIVRTCDRIIVCLRVKIKLIIYLFHCGIPQVICGTDYINDTSQYSASFHTHITYT
jgi:hypothetical protein